MKLLATVHQNQSFSKRFMSETFDPSLWSDFTKQGEVEVNATPQNIPDVLENIYAGGNDNGYGPLGDTYNRYPTAYSISTGDVIILGEMAFQVAAMGFEPIELPR